MSQPKKFYWMKQPSTFFQDPKIKKLRRIAGGDTYTIIYQKMMLISIVSGGVIIHQEIEDTLAKELSLVMDEGEDNIKVTLAFMQAQGLIEQLDSHSFLLPSVPALIGSESDSAERMRRLRDKKKSANPTLPNQKASHCDGDVRLCYTEKEKEKELELEPSLLLSPQEKEEKRDSLQTFKSELIAFCPNFIFALPQKMGYARDHKGFELQNGYIFNKHNQEFLQKNESFTIWQYLYTIKNDVFKLAQSQLNQQVSA